MNNWEVIRRNIIYAAMPRAGKTFHCEMYCKAYKKNGGAVLVYSYGKEKDFPDKDYIYFEPLGFRETAKYIYENEGKEAMKEYKMFPEIIYFRLGRNPNAQVYHISRFNEMFVLNNASLKMKKISKRVEETSFFDAIFKYISKTLIVFDDCRTTLRYFNAQHTQLFSRINHTGDLSTVKNHRGKGIDVATIWHNADRISNELIDYATDVILLKSIVKPELKELKNKWLQNAIWACWEKLKSAPKYTALHIDIENQRILNATINI